MLEPISVPCATTLVPEASQEGSLRGFKSYKDVTTFHYTIPKEVYRATWKFAAFMDDKNCLPRKVYIHLQWGSYPVISLNNTTMPPNMYSEKNGMIVVTGITTYKAETTVVVPINSPEPGDWFVGAYLSPWDQQVQQEGIGHKCHYTIGSIGIWSQENGIESIPIGYKKTMRTKQPSTYYKIFIPSGTWSFYVTVWGCSFTFNSTNTQSNLCIKGLALQGRILPIYNYTHPYVMKNLTTSSNYSFIERSPYEDSYYYLLVASDSVVDFNVEISISECPVKIMETNLKNYWATNLNHSVQVQSLPFYENLLEFEDEENHMKDYPCPRRFQLIRVKQLKTFSSVYLFKGREWLTPWILLTDTYPVIAQFNILSLVDVGGSLDIGIHLEVDKLMTKQEVTVIACIRRARVPDRVNGQIVCDNQRMMMNLSSVDRHEGNLLIPYPQPDIWHIALQVKCFSNGDPVRCDIGEILVSLNIHTRECLYSGSHPCGHNGVCEEIHRGLLYYTTCNCFGGYKGWGCSDSTDVYLRSSLILTSLMLIISNIFFLPAIYLATKRKLYAEALVYFATMLFSSFYHACDQNSVNYCIAKYEVLQYSDFFSSILAFWVTLIAMAQLHLHLVSFFHMVGVLIIAIGVESNRTGLPSILIPLAVGVTILIGNYVYRCRKLKKWKWPRGLLKLFVGLSMVILGLFLFATVETEANYQYIHSMWHATIALSLIFLLPSASNKVQPDVMINFPSSNSQLLNLNCDSDSPIFAILDKPEFLMSGSH
ncbi:hypothetical protein PV326_009042 [Microctonus aethiopoides]|nr:hypothetical protein PV326_009042 [Microctonus aethiopoides]